VDLGDELVLLGQARDGSIAATMVKVKGVFSSGQDEFDRSFMNIPLSFFQDVYAMDGAVHEVVALGKSLEDVPEIKGAIEAAIEKLSNQRGLVVLDWKELMPGLIQAIRWTW
jgi:ABC-type lipoprotein release transport system permease subunit